MSEYFLEMSTKLLSRDKLLKSNQTRLTPIKVTMTKSEIFHNCFLGFYLKDNLNFQCVYLFFLFILFARVVITAVFAKMLFGMLSFSRLCSIFSWMNQPFRTSNLE